MHEAGSGSERASTPQPLAEGDARPVAEYGAEDEEVGTTEPDTGAAEPVDADHDPDAHEATTPAAIAEPGEVAVRSGFDLQVGQRVLAHVHGRWREARVGHRDRTTVAVDYDLDATPLGGRRQRVGIDRSPAAILTAQRDLGAGLAAAPGHPATPDGAFLSEVEPGCTGMHRWSPARCRRARNRRSVRRPAADLHVLAEVALAARRLPDETYALLASFLAANACGVWPSARPLSSWFSSRWARSVAAVVGGLRSEPVVEGRC